MVNLLIKIKTAMVKLLEWAVIILFAVLVLDVLWGVISRTSGTIVVKLIERGYEPWSFLPRGQTSWTEEVAINLLMWVSLLGASVAYGEKAHLGVDYFVGKLHPQAQALTEIIVNIIVALFAALILIGGGYVLVSETLKVGGRLPALQVKIGYMYLAVPISGAFILLFCIENIIEILSGKRSSSCAVATKAVEREV
ncbi:MAG: TRAP transporter small permease [Planctomycetes bacterium]|nr:TRAP transporter small permease [Planctomycetota bacterium]